MDLKKIHAIIDSGHFVMLPGVGSVVGYTRDHLVIQDVSGISMQENSQVDLSKGAVLIGGENKTVYEFVITIDHNQRPLDFLVKSLIPPLYEDDSKEFLTRKKREGTKKQ